MKAAYRKSSVTREQQAQCIALLAAATEQLALTVRVLWCLSARGCILQVLPDLGPSHPARSSSQYWQLRLAWPCQQAPAAFLQSQPLLDLLANVLGCSRDQLLLYNGADCHFRWTRCSTWFSSSLLPPEKHAQAFARSFECGQLLTPQLCPTPPLSAVAEQYIVKPPNLSLAATAFGWHYDSQASRAAGRGLVHTPYLSLWVALDDMSADNGCLVLMPGARGESCCRREFENS